MESEADLAIKCGSGAVDGTAVVGIAAVGIAACTRQNDSQIVKYKNIFSTGQEVKKNYSALKELKSLLTLYRYSLVRLGYRVHI